MGRGENGLLIDNKEIVSEGRRTREEIIDFIKNNPIDGVKQYSKIAVNLTQEERQSIIQKQNNLMFKERLEILGKENVINNDRDMVLEVLNTTDRDIREDPLDVAMKFAINYANLRGTGVYYAGVPEKLEDILIYSKPEGDLRSYLSKSFSKENTDDRPNVKEEEDLFFNKFYPLSFRKKFPEVAELRSFNRIIENASLIIGYSFRQQLQKEIERLIPKSEAANFVRLVKTKSGNKIHTTSPYSGGNVTSCGRDCTQLERSADLSKASICTRCSNYYSLEDLLEREKHESFDMIAGDANSIGYKIRSYNAITSSDYSKMYWDNDLEDIHKKYLETEGKENLIKIANKNYLKYMPREKVIKALQGTRIKIWESQIELSVDEDTALISGAKIV